MISISVNNEAKSCDAAQSLAALLVLWGFEADKVAVAVNENFVPRGSYSTTLLGDGDRIDVLAPVQGG